MKIRMCRKNTNEDNRKKILKNRLYKALKEIDGKLYDDIYWNAVKDFRRILSDNLPPELDYSIWCENGGYRTNRDNTAKWKEYLFRIYDKTTDKTILNGTLNLAAAGTVEDPFGMYDVTIQMA